MDQTKEPSAQKAKPVPTAAETPKEVCFTKHEILLLKNYKLAWFAGFR